MRGLAAAVVIAIAVPACSSSADGGGSTTQPAAATVRADEADAGSTLTIARGTHVQVTLHSTYWRFAKPTPTGVLREATPQVYPAATSPAYPGSGAGTVVAIFTGVGHGTGTIVATRLSCGEALHCTPGEAEYRITVVVR